MYCKGIYILLYCPIKVSKWRICLCVACFSETFFSHVVTAWFLHLLPAAVCLFYSSSMCFVIVAVMRLGPPGPSAAPAANINRSHLILPLFFVCVCPSPPSLPPFQFSLPCLLLFSTAAEGRIVFENNTHRISVNHRLWLQQRILFNLC